MNSLVVDDDPLTLRLLTALLSRFGPVVQAKTGEEATQAFRWALNERNPFQLVCLDVGLPDRAGNQVLTSLRWMERARGIQPVDRARILMVTGNSDVTMIRSVITDGCDGYLLKPVDPPALLQRVTALGLLSDEEPAPAAPP